MTARSISRPITSPFARNIVGRVARSDTEVIRDLLFSAGQQGTFYVLKPIIDGNQILYQDASATTPVTADGDPVGNAQDLSPNDNDATQATSADRPTYNTDGSLHWLGFDGASDNLRSANFGLPHIHSVSVAFYPTVSADFVLDGLTVNSSSLFIVPNSPNEDKLRAYAGSVLYSSQAVTYNAWNIATVVFDGSNSVLRLNGVEVTGDTGTDTPGGVTLGARGDLGGSFFAGRVAGAAVRSGRFSAEEMTKVEEYLNGLVGGGVL